MENISNNIVQLFDEQALAQPDETAIVEYKLGRARSITFSHMRKKVLDQAKMLKRKGVTKGDLVLIMHSMSSDLYINMLAVLRVGGICLFADPSISRKTFFQMIKILRPKLVISRFMPEIYFKSMRWTIDITPVKNTDAALLTFTSGTTGQPKVIKRTHAFLFEQLNVLKKTLHVQAGEREITTLPMFVLLNLACGATTILPQGNLSSPSKIDISQLAKTIKEQRATRLLCSPSILENMLNDSNKLCFDGIKLVHTGGGAVSLRTLKELPEIFPQAQIKIVYGSSEAEPIAVLDLEEVSLIDINKSGHGAGVLVGHPVSGLGLTFEKIDELENSKQNIGEIIVSGSHVLKGTCKTGDIGYLDEQGRLWLVGRKSQTVCDTTTSLSLETACAYLEGVARAAFFRVGAKSYLYVKLLPGIKEVPEQVYRFAEMHNIDELRIRSDIPLDRRHNTKVLYRKLIPNDWRRTG